MFQEKKGIFTLKFKRISLNTQHAQPDHNQTMNKTNCVTREMHHSHALKWWQNMIQNGEPISTVLIRQFRKAAQTTVGFVVLFHCVSNFVLTSTCSPLTVIGMRKDLRQKQSSKNNNNNKKIINNYECAP